MYKQVLKAQSYQVCKDFYCRRGRFVRKVNLHVYIVPQDISSWLNVSVYDLYCKFSSCIQNKNKTNFIRGLYVTLVSYDRYFIR